MNETRHTPRIELRINRKKGVVRRDVDLTGPNAAASDVPASDPGDLVYVDVADGLRGSDLAMATALAQRIRNAKTVRIVATSRHAAEAARRVLLNAWRLDIDTTTPDSPQEASAARWAALMLATEHDDEGRP